ncbi:MAG TPA: histidine kinase [Burkholderiaceae bacterium]|nr:histidine kinase [Burkholderiaceae bacterium]
MTPDAPAFAPPRLVRGFVRRGLMSIALSLLVGFGIYSVQQDRLGQNLVYSLCIGTLCWFFIDIFRLSAARWALRRRDMPSARYGWPGWGWASACIAAGVLIAYPLGVNLAQLITGEAARPVLQRDAAAYVGVLLLSLAIAVSTTYFFYSRERLAAAHAEMEAAQRLASETRLKLLEAQLEPHMLFNTLANLRALIALDPPRAQAMLDHLIAFLRATLAGSRGDWHPLAAEFARLGDYLALMQVRMGERLQYRFDLPAPLTEVPVPPLLLQPLVENAIKHGLEPHVAGGVLSVCARATGDRQIELTVRDTGAGLAPGAGSGFGLEQVRERLAAVYGAAAHLELAAADDPAGGTVARIVLPLPA